MIKVIFSGAGLRECVVAPELPVAGEETVPYSKKHKLRSKSRIMHSATELFCRHGFDRVSIGQIMEVAKMTHGAFYNHFESKEALFSASFLESFRRGPVSRLAKAPFSIKHLAALATDYLSLRAFRDRRDPGPEAVLFNEIGSERPGIRKLYEEAYERMKKMLEVRITALGRLGKLPFAVNRDIAADRARSIIAAMVGAVAVARSITDPREQHLVLLAAQRQILAMLGVSESAYDPARIAG
ncbi:TetR/AcrR family transcriptional regulator [Microbulbifer halophilus]|uniref:TetR/AcrR family transcriptional regulator n=1 Tax=Microbulbifer halophilus TaxID=453963 RepID=A0ABW5ECF5_9GAMM|nr:TetR/AcrR family transcriptional regulator [Microbulbifer halophilus]MCW8125253.1 TetR/AcrR family transcriptional regulator [Microbulbifer halophilus]